MEGLIELITVVAAVVTVLLLGLSLWASTRMLEASTQPQVECYVRPRAEDPNVFDLVVANFGKGVAKKLVVELLDVDEEDFKDHTVWLEWRRRGPFSLLGPGESLVNLFGSGPGLVGEDKAPLKPFRVRVSYHHWEPFRFRWSDEIVNNFAIAVDSFRGMIPPWPENEVAKVLTKQLGEISREIGARRRPPLPLNIGAVDKETLGRLEALMPGLFSEMREDLKAHPLHREFILMSKHHVYNTGGKEILVYYGEDHDDLANMVGVLVNTGAVLDITFNNTDRYLMSEALVAYVSENNAAKASSTTQ